MIKKILKIVLFIILAYIVYVLISMIVPPLFRTASTHVYEKEFPVTNSHERVKIIEDNVEALEMRLKLIEEAQDEIIFTTADWFADDSGSLVMAALANAAARGVDVKVITDGLSYFTRLRGSDMFQSLAAADNVEVRIYNRISFLTPWKWNYRLHDKYLIADGRIYLLSGRNTSNLFLGGYPGRCNYDRDVLVYETDPEEASSLTDVRDYFFGMWESKYCSEVKGKKGTGEDKLRSTYESIKTDYPSVYEKTDWEEVTKEVGSIRLIANPINLASHSPDVWDGIIYEMKKGSDISVITPYFIIDGRLLNEITGVCEGERNINVITNSVYSGANVPGCADFLNNRKKLAKSPMEIYAYSGDRSRHTKTVLIDDNISIVGSFNYDMRSIYLDTEMMLVIDSPEINAELRSEAEKAMDSSAHLLADGTSVNGKDFAEREIPAGKKILLTIVRVLILPFRYLL